MTRSTRIFPCLGALLSAGLLLPAGAAGQTAAPPVATLSIEEYEPKSTLVVPEHRVPRARFPFIDVHNHQESSARPEEIDRIVRDMDALGMRVMVNLSGGSGDVLAAGVRNWSGLHPGRFVTFANLDFSGIENAAWGTRAAAQLERDVRQGGARGLKIFKNFGLTVKDRAGRRIPVDDSRLDAVFEKCADLKIPVLIHSGEPRSFFEPQDAHNERWLELKQFPQRARPPDRFPTFEQVMGEQHRLFARHPRTTFIDAHLGWMGGDLASLGALLDRLPNVTTEIGAVLAELGRQPRFAREWFIRYQDRVMMGKDTWAPEEYPVYFRVLETADEYFDYYRRRHAFWKMYGLDLPDEVLRKLYYRNALRVIPGIDSAAFPQ
ncbi:MAG: amidohydrolase family protein [Acidobacteriota bacterium]